MIPVISVNSGDLKFVYSKSTKEPGETDYNPYENIIGEGLISISELC
jgi:hypothetical protein